jgi:tRNA(Ile)-lysidine synthase
MNDSAVDTASVHRLLSRCVFPQPGTNIRCAVSGGPDSSALLVLAVAAGCDVTAIHVDHQLRAGSGDDADVVGRLARRFNVAFLGVTVEVGHGPNLEARARAARHDALGPGALFGHTADDQAENVLLALLRGTGLDGLAAMDPTTHPLLGLRRAETEALCAQLGIVTVNDPSNDDLAFRRNDVRHRLVPLMNDIAQRDVVPLLARTAELVAAETSELNQAADQLDPTDTKALLAAPEAVARRALRRWLSNPYPPDRAGLDRVWQVVTGQVIGCEIAGGVAIRRTNGRLRQVPLQEN